MKTKPTYVAEKTANGGYKLFTVFPNGTRGLIAFVFYNDSFLGKGWYVNPQTFGHRKSTKSQETAVAAAKARYGKPAADAIVAVEQRDA
jgi:hypothetical protein